MSRSGRLPYKQEVRGSIVVPSRSSQGSDHRYRGSTVGTSRWYDERRVLYYSEIVPLAGREGLGRRVGMTGPSEFGLRTP